MPEMNGCDLAKQLQLVIPGFKIIFMSGYSSDVRSSTDVMTEGVNFIQKPFSLKTLTTMVRDILNRSES